MIVLKYKNKKGDGIIKVGLSKVTVGRSSKCDHKIDDEMCSSLHCVFKLEKNGRLSIKDLGSTNGTFINDNTITETFVYLNDKIKIGSTILQLDPSKMDAGELEIHENEDTIHRNKSIHFNLAKNILNQVDSNKTINENINIALEKSKNHENRIKELKAHEKRILEKKLSKEEEKEEESINIITKFFRIFKKK